MWQDYVFALGSLVFVVALIPSIRSVDKPALTSSLLTGSILLVFALTYVTMDLWYACATTLATSACWFTLAWQKART